jgi:hypothetical protein
MIWRKKKYFSDSILHNTSNQKISTKIIFTHPVLEANTGMSKIGTFCSFRDFV